MLYVVSFIKQIPFIMMKYMIIAGNFHFNLKYCYVATILGS